MRSKLVKIKRSILVNFILTLSSFSNHKLKDTLIGQQPYDNLEDFVKGKRQKKKLVPNVIKLRNDEPSRYYCLDGVFI